MCVCIYVRMYSTTCAKFAIQDGQQRPRQSPQFSKHQEPSLEGPSHPSVRSPLSAELNKQYPVYPEQHKWSPDNRYTSLLTPSGPGSGPRPPKIFSGTCPFWHLEDLEVFPHPRFFLFGACPS